MADLTLTKGSGRLKVDIGAVLCTRVNTGDCRFMKLLAGCRKTHEVCRQGQDAEMG